MNQKLNINKKKLQHKYLKEMDKNLKEKPNKWQNKNIELSKKIETLFKKSLKGD